MQFLQYLTRYIDKQLYIDKSSFRFLQFFYIFAESFLLP